MWKIEKAILFLVALMGVGFYFQVDDLPPSAFQYVDAADFTKVMLVLLWIGIFLVYLEHKKKEKGGKSEKERLLPPGIAKWQFVTLCAMASFCVLFTILGYFTTGFLVLVVYMHFLFYAQMQRLKLKDSLKLTAIAFVSIFFLYLVFGVMFDLWLPKGILI